MPFCATCGEEVHTDATICLGCGVATKNSVTKDQPIDIGGCGWGLLGFFVPIVGLILYLVWKYERPQTSKSVGFGALMSIVISTIVFVIYHGFIIIFVKI